MMNGGMLQGKFFPGSPVRKFTYRSAQPALVCKLLSPRVLYRTIMFDPHWMANFFGIRNCANLIWAARCSKPKVYVVTCKASSKENDVEHRMVSIRSLIAIIFLIHAQGSLSARLTYFYARVLAVVCFGGGHRTLYKKQLYALDVLFRKLCRSCVSPPSDTDRSLEWHEIFHRCNDRARTFTQTVGPKPWSYCVCMQHWKLASHIVNLLEHRWVRRLVAWNPPVGYRILGRRRRTGIVWGHGWRKRNAIITGLRSLKLATPGARCEIHCIQN